MSEDWRDVDMGRTRAADRAPNAVQKPVAVVQTSREGDYPSGDSTMWGGEIRQRITLSTEQDESNPLRLVTSQIVRAQVSDNRPRVWSWIAQIESTIVSGSIVPVSSDLITDPPLALLWTMGTGLSMFTAKESLIDISAASAQYWAPEVSANRFVATLRPGMLVQAFYTGVPYIVDPRPMGEHVGVRFAATLANADPMSGPAVVDLRITMALTPEHATP